MATKVVTKQKRMTQTEVINHFAERTGMKRAQVKEFFEDIANLAALAVLLSLCCIDDKYATLRSRPSDIPLLIQHFLDPAQKTSTRSQKPKIEDRALALLSAYG
jgi:transcriptional regulator of aromatic amino acid metabolism